MAQQNSKKRLFNDNWLFAKEEFKDASIVNFDDSNWESVRLPHDWAIDGPFAEEFGPRSGGLPSYGIGWYRKYFKLPESAKDRQIIIHFDGAMKNAEVFVNGKFVGARPYGYSSFVFEISSYLKFGEEDNVIAVKLSPEELSSRWYSGAGLYRNVWIEYNDPLHIKNWGVKITTTKVSDKKAEVVVNTTIQNDYTEAKSAKLKINLINAEGKEVSSKSTPIDIKTTEQLEIEENLIVTRPQVWGIDNPYLYRAFVTLEINGQLIDQKEIDFGIRSIEFTQEGFFLNEKRVRLKGVCMHSDLGPLGAAINYRGLERQLEIMKEMGVNALRTSHNPTSPEQLEICDRLGILVIEEAFDSWEMNKVPNDYSKYFKEWHRRDLQDMIRRDINHPSIIMWSIGNEILEQSKKSLGAKIAKDLTDIIHLEDPTRPSTAGFNNLSAIKNKLADEVDIVGFNYKPTLYEKIKLEHPDWIIYGSETESTVSTRGTYHLPIEKYIRHPSRHITSYDLIGPPWAYPPDIEFYFQEKNPNVLGEFVWTGFDYLGEPTPYGGKDNDTEGAWKGDWVSRSSYFGIVDLVGFPKDRYYSYQSQWTEKPMVHIIPHWNWEGKGFDTIPVHCYTNAEEAELFLNGRSLGRKIKGKDLTAIKIGFRWWEGDDFQSPYRLSWDVPYEPGTLKVVAYKGGKVVAEQQVSTAGEPYKISLKPDKKVLTADGYDLSYITVKIEDKEGNLCPEADDLVRFSVEGAGEFTAVGNGNQATTLLFNEPYRPAFNGKCMLIVKSINGQIGPIIIRAKSGKLLPQTIEIFSQHK